jgi:hypothetical protein
MGALLRQSGDTGFGMTKSGVVRFALGLSPNFSLTLTTPDGGMVP